MPRPRQQVIEALTESNNEILEEFPLLPHEYDECDKCFVDEVLKIMLVNYKKSGDLKLLAMGCKTIIEIIEKD